MAVTMGRVVCIVIVIVLGLILGSLAQCPVSDPCSCFDDEDGGKVINCRNRQLGSVPTFNPTTDSFSVLSLGGNGISSIGQRAFYTTDGEPLNVRKIDLETMNSVNTIHDEAFQGMLSVRELLLGMGGDTFPATPLSELSNLERLTIRNLHIVELPERALQPLTKLQHLEMTGCSLVDLSDSDVSGQTGSLKELILEDNSLKEIPTVALNTLSRLETLHLDRNHIVSVPADAFSNMPSLRELVLSQNTLQSIHSNAFRGVEDTLEELSLYYCRLHDNTLPPLSRLRSLRKLILKNNDDIQRIPQDLFRNMNSLEELDLLACSLSSIDQDTFRGADKSLKQLDLGSNKITTIAPFTFQAFSALQILLLKGNDLHVTLSLNTFRGLQESLQRLNLEDTHMTTQNLEAIQYLSELRFLTLNYNAIESLPDYIFAQLYQIESLEFNKNLLSNIQHAAMFGLRDSVKSINFRENDIRQISHCTFQNFDVLETILLANNPLECDCHARWLRVWIEKYNPFDRDQIKWQCAGPAEHNGKYIKDMDEEDFVCSDGEQIEVCEILTTPTIPDYPDMTVTPTSGPLGLQVNVTDATEQELTVIWKLRGGGEVRNFAVDAIEAGADGDEEPIFDDVFTADVRNTTMYGLLTGTMYTICVTAYYSEPMDYTTTECINATTSGSSLPVSNAPSSLAIIVGTVLGVVVFVILVVIIVVVIRRTKSTHPYKHNGGGLPESRADLPTMGYNSKRFSKPRSTMTSVGGSCDDLERKLDGFTQEERNRILQLLSSSQMSLASAGSTRYLDEPRGPRRWTGGASGTYYNEEDPYHEIPMGEDYEYIPADQVTKYDYIPADQVVRPGAVVSSGGDKTPPPLPPPHPESSTPPRLTDRDSLSQPIPLDPSPLPYIPQPETSEWI